MTRDHEIRAHVIDLRARLDDALIAAGAERKRRAEAEAHRVDLEVELERTKKKLAAAQSDLRAERHARAAQYTTLGLAGAAARDAQAQVSALRARAGALGQRSSRAPSSPPGRTTQMLAALRGLALTPDQMVRDPRRLKTLARVGRRPQILKHAIVVMRSGLFDETFYVAANPDVGRANPLAHYLMWGGLEGRSPHPLFDGAGYLRVNPDVAAARTNPLVHYLLTGAREGRDPHPLFSARYYSDQLGLPLGQINVLQHYVWHGAAEGRSPHPLFDPWYYLERFGDSIGDTDPFIHFLGTGSRSGMNPHPVFDTGWYRRQAPDLAETNEHPLVHYLETGWRRGLCPHPLFNPRFYVTRYTDVAAQGIEPLTHFLTVGGREGRSPIPEFDSSWYLAAYEDVRTAGANPLVHYLRTGWREGRSPSATFDSPSYIARYADVLATDAEPLQHYLTHGRAEGRSASREPAAGVEPPASARSPLRLEVTNAGAAVRNALRTVICLTHVLPVRPRAGNEYRIHRMLRWMKHAGYTIVPLVAPNDGSRPSREDVEEIAKVFGNAVLVLPDGHIEYILRDVPDTLASLNGASLHARELPWEADAVGDDERALLQMDRAFCTDAVMEVLLRLETCIGPYALLAEYIWMSRVLPLARADALKVIDTHDVFSTRAEKVDRYGVNDLSISPSDERERLLRADVLIAIQPNERRELEALAPGVRVVTGGVDFDVLQDAPVSSERGVLCVASGNPMNRQGLRDFLRFAWPRVRERVPDATLTVAGSAGDALVLPPDGVRVLGRVEDLRPLYAAARVVINPVSAGTGVKIKTLEALAHLRPLVAWPSGVDGLSPGLAALCSVASDWLAFAATLVDLLSSDRPRTFTDAERDILFRESAPAFVYAELDAVLDDYFRSAGVPATAPRT